MIQKLLSVLLVLLFLSTWHPLSAQAPITDIVNMKDGRILSGKIIYYMPGGSLRLELPDGTVQELLDRDISKIQQGAALNKGENKQKSPKKMEVQPLARTQGLYAVSMLAFAAGQGANEGLALGAGFSQVFGFQFNRLLGIGAGFGVDNYSRRGETVYPIFGEVRSFLTSKKQSGNFYALGAGGYSFAFAREQREITNANGGLMVHFALGYRAITEEGIDINVDIGPKFQAAHFERKLFNGDTEFRDVNFQRIVIRVGLGLWK